MSERERRLKSVAETIADDLPVEWTEADDPWLDTRMRNLMALERIRTVYRDIESTTGTKDPVAGERSDPDRHLPSGDSARPAASWGDLKLVEKVGAGATAEVFRAWNPALQTYVALKLLRDGRSSELPEKYLAEARQLAKVRHPNVVTVHGAASEGGRVGLWMDFVQGRTLEVDLRERGPWSANEAALVGLDLVRALAAVHGAGLVHRDVKTSNIMRERGGRVLLMDFGTALERPKLDELSASESFVGTARFMAPEIFRGEAIGKQCDIYSLGVVLYRLVTGRYPIDAADAVALRDKHARGEAVALREARPDLPLGFVRVVEKALAADPAQRYASVAEMERDLASYVGAPEEDRPGTFWRRALFVLAAVAVIAGAIWVARDRLFPPAFEVQAQLFRVGSGVEERLRPGGRISPGDRLFLELGASRDLYLYVFNEDEVGNSFLLFPLQDMALGNPLRAGKTHRLPGTRESGEQITWDVTSAGGREQIYLVASVEPLDGLEQEIARLPQAGGATSLPLSRDAVQVLHRGLGGISEVPPWDPKDGAPLSDVFERFADPQVGKGGVWAWSIVLENPLP